MEVHVDLSTIRCLPRQFLAKDGQPADLCLLEEACHGRLLEMYLAYQPRNSFQGLPPIKDAVCIQWVEGMIRTGVNIVAMRPAEGVVGHIALFPINPSKCEMLVVVSPAFQNQGIGTELTRSLVDLAEELGFAKIWLPVDSTNLRARHVYRKCGFQYVSDWPSPELDMVLDLAVRRSATPPVVPLVVPPLPLPDSAASC